MDFLCGEEFINRVKIYRMGMKVLDLAYETFSAGASGIQKYEEVHPALFSHYFRYWAERGRFSDCLMTHDRLSFHVNIVKGGLRSAEMRIASFGLPLDDIVVIFFTGQNTSNGHAFMNEGRMIVWLPVETYHTPLQAEVFATHEIIHGIHYLLSPAFMFCTEDERMHTGRQLISEGIATYITKQVLGISDGVSLWADYLDGEKFGVWFEECSKREKELKKYCLERFSYSGSDLSLFFANDPDDIFSYRAGYYLGLQFANWFAKQLKSDHDLLCTRRSELEQAALHFLSV